jgi:hypothetical protein
MPSQLIGSSRTKLTQSCRETATGNFVSDFKSLTQGVKETGGMA